MLQLRWHREPFHCDRLVFSAFQIVLKRLLQEQAELARKQIHVTSELQAVCSRLNAANAAPAMTPRSSVARRPSIHSDTATISSDVIPASQDTVLHESFPENNDAFQAQPVLHLSDAAGLAAGMEPRASHPWLQLPATSSSATSPKGKSYIY